MKPEIFEGVNHIFGAPEDWDEKNQGICRPVHAFVGQCEHKPGNVYVVTAWRPSAEDLNQLNNGGLLYLQVYGGMPPVCLYTVNPDGSPNHE